MTEDRGRDVSRELTEVRTVLSRAQTALNTLDHFVGVGHHWGWKDRQHIELPLDEDIDEMRNALSETVRALARWERTGKKPR